MDLNTIAEIAQPRSRGEMPAWQAGDAWLAGGTWLYSEPQPKLRRLIDLASLGWEPLRVTPEGLEIAATCKIAQLDGFAMPPEWTAAPLINQCCRAFYASFKIWNMATIGGNLCLALPAGPVISLTTALDGVCTLWAVDGSERRLPVVDFITGWQKNALAPGELLRSIFLPNAALTRRTVFRQISLAPLGRSAALLIGALAARDGIFALTITASTPRPVQIAFDELPSASELESRIERTIPASGYFDDVHGTPAWRRQMTLHLAEEIRAELAGGR
jgi:CO/xanthine dehydrogenase FAD-binding subunit